MAIKSVGAYLRDAREKQGFSLEDIGAHTRITAKCLLAIENDEVNKLSSPFFYRSFVRQYAEQVGLDYRQLSPSVEVLAANMREPDLPGQGEYPPVRIAPIQPRIKRDFSWVYPVLMFFVTVVAISSGYAAWRYQPVWLTDSAVGAFVRSLHPAQAASLSSTSQLVQPKVPVEIKANVVPEPAQAVPEETTAGRGDATDPNQAPSAADSTPDPDVTTVIVPDNSTRADSGIHLELAATERTWLSVTADGRTAYSGILEKEQVKVLDGQESAELRTGNAAGVNITFNGKQIGAIGPRGTTRRVIFTKTSFEIFPQTHPMFSRATRIGG